MNHQKQKGLDCIFLQELREEAKKWDQKLDELGTKEAQLHQRVAELRAEEKHLLQVIEEISESTTLPFISSLSYSPNLTFLEEKTAAGQKEIVELLEAAKNCKVSADEARRIKAEIAANQRDYDAVSEQRSQVAKLVEKRELQLANIIAEDIKFDRELNVDLMDMGMTVGSDVDRRVRLRVSVFS